LYEIQQGGHTIKDDLDAIIFNAVAATIRKWRTFKLLRRKNHFVKIEKSQEPLAMDGTAISTATVALAIRKLKGNAS
jgi:hypothetical protein